MSIETPAPVNPLIAPNTGTLVPGLASAFRGSINAYMSAIEDKAQYVQYYVEQTNALMGFGCVSGGTIAAGTALDVTVTPYEAYVGNYMCELGTASVGELTANNTNYIYLRQDGSFTVNTAGTLPSGDGHGHALLWGQAVTDGTAVTTVDNERRFVEYAYGGTAISYSAGGTVTLTPAEYGRPCLAFSGTATGTVVVSMPAQAYAAWDVINAGSAALAFCASSGGSALVATTKAARILCDGTNYRTLVQEA